MPEINAILNNLPAQSGVYIMLDENKNILYVGKAKSLKNRVRQYFYNNAQTEKTLVLVSKIKDINYIVTPTEYDALILENNLIKEHKPPYNILLKDDKTYPYIKIVTKSDYPTLEITRKLKADGARYFGPYMLGISVSEIIKLIQSAFPVRTCKNTSFYRAKRECLNYHIGRCLAPCAGRVSKEEYAKIIDKVIEFLSGDNKEIEQRLKDKMNSAASRQDFESALYYRDMLQALDKLNRKQAIPFKIEPDIDIFTFATNGEIAVINVSAVRGGKLLGSENFALNDTSYQNAMSAFIMQYYDKNPVICDEILVNEELEFGGELNDYLSGKTKNKINIVCPLGGIRKQLTEISLTNAKIYLDKQAAFLLRKEDLTLGAVRQLKEYLNLETLPRRMECYDISNISGQDKVASMAVFEDGEACKKHYRHFKIKTVKGANDFASIKEALQRRLKRLAEGNSDISFSKKPDLLIIDGGKGQLSSAMEALKSAGADIPVISLAKREEEVFMPQVSGSVILPKDSLALKLLIRIRDEAHRFAIAHFRKLHRQKQTVSELTEIEGIGKERAKQLLTHFRGIDKIKSADVEQLCQAKGISRSLAQKIYAHFHKDDNTKENL